MRIVVTGGSGRAGVWTVRDFAEHGHEVINLDGRASAEPLPGSFIKLDLTDAGEVYDAFVQTQPDAVCHLAANPSP
ncbi:MAG: NAD(P)-dependent oxidoreductase, partial [Caldilineaceae bacterium]